MATRNGAATLPAVLDACCRLEAPDGGWTLLVIDDGSTDGTRALLEGYAARLPLRVLGRPHGGKSAALNAGIELALAEPDAALFVFTDDDASPRPDWLARLQRCAVQHPQHALFGGSIVPGWGAAPPDWVLRLVPLGLTYAITDVAEGPVFPGLVWGANMAVRRAVFEAGHRFDSAIGPNGGAYAMGSETEFNLRIGAAGFPAWFCAGAVVAHYIRPHQLEEASILRRAHRFGRGMQVQPDTDGCPQLLRVPRWMFARFALELGGALRALLRRDRDEWFRRRWELNYLRGYIGQAWRGPRVRTPDPVQRRRLLITSCSGQLGGMELRMGQEARILAGAGWHSIVATPRFPGRDAMAADLRAGGVEASVFDPPQFFEQWAWRRSNQLRARVLAARRLRRFRADLVHVAFCWTSYGASLLWLAHHCKLPSVVSVHSAFPATVFAPWHARRYAQAFSSVRGVYAVSHSSLQHFVANFGRFLPPSARLCVIPNGVDHARFLPSTARRASARARLGLAPDSLVLGSVARLSREKRPEALVELFCALRNRFKRLHLVLAGSGPLESALRAKVEALGLAPFVVFTGRVEAVEELLPAFDLHLLLSRSEGFGISTIEAMSCGVPVVGTDVPGTADILRASQAGLLVPVHDTPRAVEAVAALLDDAPRRAQMAMHARAEVLANYTLERMDRQLRDFYAAMLP